MSIVIQEDNNAQIVLQRNPLVYNWKFSPPKLKFFWLMNAVTPGNFQSKIEFPALDELPAYSAFTDWKFEANLDFFNAMPFCAVEGDYSYEGTLGVPFTAGGNYYRKTLNFSFVALNLLSEGIYQCNVICSVTAVNPSTNMREVISDSYFEITFQASAFYLFTTPFDVAWQGQQVFFNGTEFVNTPLIFNWTIGDPLPPLQELFYFNAGLTIPPSVITSDALVTYAHTAIHEYFSKFDVGFDSDIDLLAVGTYNHSIRLEYFGVFSSTGVTVDIILNVLAPTSGFYITPNTLTFDFILGAHEPQHLDLNLVSSGPWNIVGNLPSWLMLSQYNGAGNATIFADIVNTGNLTTGPYNTTIVFDNGTDQILVPVTLNFYAFLRTPFQSGKLYFTKELDYMKFDSTTLNTYIEINLEIKVFKINTNEPIVYEREYNFPLFKGKGDFHIGSIVETLLEEIEKMQDYIPDVDNNYFKNQQLPAEVKVSFFEKEYTETGATNLVYNLYNKFLMIKGYKPFTTESQLCILSVAQQDVTRITPNSIIGVSFVNFKTTLVLVKQNGIVIDQFTAISFSNGSSQKIIFSFFRFNNNFKPGDSIEIVVLNNNESRSQRYLVMRESFERTYFFFENENRVLEPFEFIGRRRIGSKITHTTNKKIKNLVAFEEKVFANNLQSIIVNTGQLTKTEHRIVNAIVHSTKVWCSLDNPKGPYFRVDSITSKIDNQDTAGSEENFDVEFNIIENTDGTVYPL